MSNKTYYCISTIETKRPISVFGKEIPIELTWADGMVGVMPVFATIQDASRYADDNDILAFEVKEG